jgi:type II secretory pathway component PulF
MALLPALQVALSMEGNLKVRAKMDEMINKIAEGAAFSIAAEGFIPSMALGSLRAAERAGNFEEILGQLAEYYEQKAEMEEKVIGALAYPCFVLILSLLSVLVLIVFVLPGIKSLFVDMGAELPLFSRMALGLSDGIIYSWPAIIIILSMAGWMLFRWGKTHPERLENIILHTPLFGKLIRQELVIQSFGTLGALLRGGAPIIEALTITAHSSRSIIFKKVIFLVKDGVENGESLSEQFAKSGFFAQEAIQMLKVGESSGRLGEMLSNISKFQSREREIALKRFTGMLEPAMTLSVGLVVGVVILAMFLPMINMISLLN